MGMYTIYSICHLLFYVVGEMQGSSLSVGKLHGVAVVGNLTGQLILVGNLPPSQLIPQPTTVRHF